MADDMEKQVKKILKLSRQPTANMYLSTDSTRNMWIHSVISSSPEQLNTSQLS